MRARQLALPVHLGGSLAALALAPWWPALLLWPLLYLLLLAMASLQSAWKHRSACALLCGPAAGVMHLSWAAGFFAGLIGVRESAWPGAVQAP
jgi:succinoglycan biosynthesis protein ExoA